MSESAVLAALETWFGAQAAPISTPVRYKHAAPWPYEGTYPYVVMAPLTQRRNRYSNSEVYLSGVYRLLYVDAVGLSQSSPGALLLAAGDWADAVMSALQSSEANRSLNGAVAYVGESMDGSEGGMTLNWDDKQAAVDAENRLVWGLPLDIWVTGLPEPG